VYSKESFDQQVPQYAQRFTMAAITPRSHIMCRPLTQFLSHTIIGAPRSSPVSVQQYPL
jgi:hypothetical protein